MLPDNSVSSEGDHPVGEGIFGTKCLANNYLSTRHVFIDHFGNVESDSKTNQNRFGLLNEILARILLAAAVSNSGSLNSPRHARAQYWSRKSFAGAAASKPQHALTRPCAMCIVIQASIVASAFGFRGPWQAERGFLYLRPQASDKSLLKRVHAVR